MSAGERGQVPRGHWCRGGVWVVVVSLLAAACGSTAPRQENSARGPDFGESEFGEVAAGDTVEDGGGFEDSASSPDGAAGRSGGAPTGSRAGSRAAGGTGGESPTADRAPAAGGPRAMGAGVTADTIRIGIGWLNFRDAAPVLTPGQDTSRIAASRDEPEAVVRWMNEHGGIAGRQIEPVYYEYPFAEAVTPAGRQRQEQEMCASWTEDRAVLAALPYWPVEGVFYECAARQNLVTVISVGGSASVDREWFEDVGHIWYSPHGFSADRREEVFVDQLDREGFFTPDAKVGLLIFNNPPEIRVAERVTEPALEALGVEVVARDIYDYPHNWENTVLRFRTAGVTHVLWGATAAGASPPAFSSAAENQGYRPSYAYGSDSGLASIPTDHPEGQRHSIVGIASSSSSLGTEAYEHEAPINENDARCREIRNSAGSNVYQALWTQFCEGLFFVKQAVEAAPELTTEGFRQAVESPGFRYASVLNWSTRFGANRHGGANGVRIVRYDAECECLRWTSQVRELG